ncbi:MAG TPA: hypothetical protein PLJ29_04755 [Leptospiraceae bacterium]|nr:hypothetical protein [Leptospiraceae bacterium]
MAANMNEEEEWEIFQDQKKLAMSTIDDLTHLKIELIEANIPVPNFINNATRYLKQKYLVGAQTIGEMIRVKN